MRAFWHVQKGEWLLSWTDDQQVEQISRKQEMGKKDHIKPRRDATPVIRDLIASSVVIYVTPLFTIREHVIITLPAASL